MPTVALMTDGAELIAFLLVAGSEDLAGGPEERDCVLTGVPKRAELLAHPLCDLLQRNKNVERRARVTGAAQATTLRADLADENVLELTLAADGRGKLSVRGAVGELDGLCMLAPKRR